MAIHNVCFLWGGWAPFRVLHMDYFFYSTPSRLDFLSVMQAAETKRTLGRSTKPLNQSGGNRVEREDDRIALMEGRKGGAEAKSEGSTEFSQVGRQRQSFACREFTREKNSEARKTTAYQESTVEFAPKS